MAKIEPGANGTPAPTLTTPHDGAAVGVADGESVGVHVPEGVPVANGLTEFVFDALDVADDVLVELGVLTPDGVPTEVADPVAVRLGDVAAVGVLVDVPDELHHAAPTAHTGAAAIPLKIPPVGGTASGSPP